MLLLDDRKTYYAEKTKNEEYSSLGCVSIVVYILLVKLKNTRLYGQRVR